MAQITNFFVGANSGEGFRNLFPQMVDLEDTYDFMILKGGPGVGKNTFMREIGRTMEQAGTAVEYLWCSGDPDSLDGVVIPELRSAVADGTSPHGSVSKGRAGTVNRYVYIHAVPSMRGFCENMKGGSSVSKPRRPAGFFQNP